MAGNDSKQSIFLAYQETQGFLRRYLRRFYKNPQDIEDAMQEGFLKSFEIEKKQNITTPSAYLFKTIRNFACRDLRKKSRLKIIGIEDIDLPSLTIDRRAIENSLESRQNLSIFCTAADLLPEQCRKAFLLRKVYGFSQKEIAGMMGISVSTVEKHLAKAVRRVIEHMDQHGDDIFSGRTTPEKQTGSRDS